MRNFPAANIRGDCGDPIRTHLKVILKDGNLLTALPYSVANLTGE